MSDTTLQYTYECQHTVTNDTKLHYTTVYMLGTRMNKFSLKCWRVHKNIVARNNK